MIEDPNDTENLGLFEDLLAMLATGGFIHLGALRSSEQAEARIDLDAARHVIDLMQMLEAKTRGNRTPEEDRALRETLSALQLRFVQVADSPAPPPSATPPPSAASPGASEDDTSPPRFHKTYG